MEKTKHEFLQFNLIQFNSNHVKEHTGFPVFLL